MLSGKVGDAEEGVEVKSGTSGEQGRDVSVRWRRRGRKRRYT